MKIPSLAARVMHDVTALHVLSLKVSRFVYIDNFHARYCSIPPSGEVRVAADALRNFLSELRKYFSIIKLMLNLNPTLIQLIFHPNFSSNNNPTNSPLHKKHGKQQ